MARRERAASTRRALIRPAPLQTSQQRGRTAPLLPWSAAPTDELPFETANESWLALCGLSDDSTTRAHITTLAFDFSPRVNTDEPDAILLEVRGSFRLFGGARALCRQFVERTTSLGGSLSWALAPTPLAALALARARQQVIVLSRERLVGLLSPLPPTVLRWPEATRQRLESIGVRSLGDVLRLPRAGFAQRFGQAALQSLDRLTGAAVDLRRNHRKAERFRGRIEPSFELQSDALILRHLEPVLLDLEHFLCLRQAAIEALQLRLRHVAPHAETRLVLRFAAPQWQAAACRELLALQLARSVLPAAVISCELRSGALRPRVACSAALWRGSEQGAGVAAGVPALVERLRARLGEEAVYGLCLVPEHRPERASRIAEPALGLHVVGSDQTSLTNDIAIRRSFTRRPLWLLQQPRVLPWPLAKLQLLEGPERIETGWWDGAEVARDYYIARHRDGSRLWIYRRRALPHEWYWHGVFG